MNIINAEQAVKLAIEYKHNGDLDIMDISELLKYILWCEESEAVNIAHLAFSDFNIHEGIYKSPLSKYEIYGSLHPNDIENFVYYFRWSLNKDAVDLRNFANIMDKLSNIDIEIEKNEDGYWYN